MISIHYVIHLFKKFSITLLLTYPVRAVFSEHKNTVVTKQVLHFLFFLFNFQGIAQRLYPSVKLYCFPLGEGIDPLSSSQVKPFLSDKVFTTLTCMAPCF